MGDGILTGLSRRGIQSIHDLNQRFKIPQAIAGKGKRCNGIHTEMLPLHFNTRTAARQDRITCLVELSDPAKSR